MINQSNNENINKSNPNNLAMFTNRIAPSKFANTKQLDPDVFLENMISFLSVMQCDETKVILFFRMSLEGEAAVWLQTLPAGITFSEMCTAFKNRWSRKNKTLCAINALADVSLN